jgi:LysM repeat protein
MQHIVEKGETLMAIAKEYNTSLAEIIQANNLKNPNSIQIGQIIEIPNPETKIVSHSILTPENINEKIEKFLNFIEGKKLKRPLTSIGRECVKLIFQKCLELKVTDLRMVSYILATTYWETGAYGQRYIYEPVPEQGKGRGRPYGIPHKKTGKIYYGRGFVQLTWFDNYERFTKILYRLGFEVDLMSNPDLALKPEIAVLILVIGMRDGKFTGADLDDYFDPIKSDWYNARKIINKLDKAVIIADIAKEIHYIIK